MLVYLYKEGGIAKRSPLQSNDSFETGNILDENLEIILSRSCRKVTESL